MAGQAPAKRSVLGFDLQIVPMVVGGDIDGSAVVAPASSVTVLAVSCERRFTLMAFALRLESSRDSDRMCGFIAIEIWTAAGLSPANSRRKPFGPWTEIGDGVGRTSRTRLPAPTV
jgi:hypothetical protein